jgi:hypothetical protein
MSHQNNNIDPVQQWISEDAELSKVLVEIQESGLSVEEQAEMAFHKVTDMYGVPKLPEDVPDVDDGEDKASVYQELGLIKYLYPENDLRGSVLAAIYAVKNGINVDDSEIDHTAISGLCYKGENSKVELVLVQKGQSWVELGCKLFTRKY